MSMRINKDVCASLFFMLFSIAMFLTSLNMNTLSILTIGVGSDFTPILVSIAIFCFSSILFIQSLRKKPNKQEEVEEVASTIEKVIEEESNSAPTITKSRLKNVGYASGLILLYVLVMPYLGFIIASSIYIILQGLLLSNNRKKAHILLPFSVGGSIIIYCTFRFGFNLMLPIGLLG